MTQTAKQLTPRKATHLKARNVEVSDASVQHFMGLDYPIDLIKDDDSFVASYPDLPGCMSFGDSPNEAVQNLNEVKGLWIVGQLNSGHEVPAPSSPDRYSGKFVLRIPKMLHRIADFRARQEGVSLNTFVCSLVAGALHYPNREDMSLHVSVQRGPQWAKPADAWHVVDSNVLWNVSGHSPSPELGSFVKTIASTFRDSGVYSSSFKEHRNEQSEARFLCK